jgi:cytochrome P450
MGPRRQIMFPLFGDGIFTQDGPNWRHSRELLRPQFSYRNYQNLDVFREHVDNLISNLPSNEEIVDLQPLFFRLTLDTTTAFLFADSVYSLSAAKEAGETTFAGAFNTAQAYMAKRYRLQDLYWVIGGKKFNECCAVVHEFADKILDRTLDQGADKSKERDSRYRFLDAVAESTPDRKALRHQMINILVAGRDTTACLLSWTMSVETASKKMFQG